LRHRPIRAQGCATFVFNYVAKPMDVSAWLRDLGFACYESAFRNNDIDSSVLPDLTADDLRDRAGCHRRAVNAH
jgi:hypothetical protein